MFYNNLRYRQFTIEYAVHLPPNANPNQISHLFSGELKAYTKEGLLDKISNLKKAVAPNVVKLEDSIKFELELSLEEIGKNKEKMELYL